MTERVAIVQPYLTKYNEPLFARMSEALSPLGVELIIIHGTPGKQQGARLDHADMNGSRGVRTTHFGGRLGQVDWKHTAAAVRAFRPRFIILEQARDHVESYGHMLHSLLGGPRIAWWGHGKAYHKPESHVASAWRQGLLARGDWLFAYTQGGADHAVQRGFPRTRVSVLNNTVDTEVLVAELASVTELELSDFRAATGARQGRTALFIGGVDSDKGIEFLLASERLVSELIPDFTLLVAGRGEQEHLVVEAQRRGARVRYLGRIEGRQKAVALAASDVLAIPQAVGLVAVDSLVSSRAIVTTSGHGHGPEFEYLRPGSTCIVTAPEPHDYAQAVAALLTDERERGQMGANALADAPTYSISRMVDEFVWGIRDWMDVANAELGRAGRRHG